MCKCSHHTSSKLGVITNIFYCHHIVSESIAKENIFSCPFCQRLRIHLPRLDQALNNVQSLDIEGKELWGMHLTCFMFLFSHVAAFFCSVISPSLVRSSFRFFLLPFLRSFIPSLVSSFVRCYFNSFALSFIFFSIHSFGPSFLLVFFLWTSFHSFDP